MNNLIRLLFALHILLFASVPATAQGWDIIYEEDVMQSPRQAVALPTGGYLIAGFSADIDDPDTLTYYLQQIDDNGAVQWIHNFADHPTEYPVNTTLTVVSRSLALNLTGNGVRFYGLVSSDTTFLDQVLVADVSSAGTLQNSYLFETDQEDVQEITLLADGNLLLLGNLAELGEFSLEKRTPDGDEIWEYQFPSFMSNQLSRVQELPDGSILIATQQYLVRLTADGELISEQQKLIPSTYPNDLHPFTPDSLLAVGAFGEPLSHNLFSIEPSTGLLGVFETELPSDNEWTSWMTSLPDGSNVCSASSDVFADAKIRLTKFDPSGGIVWDRTFTYTWVLELSGMIPTLDSGFLLYASITDGAGIERQLVIKTDSLGLVNTNFVEGKLYIDANENCAFDSGEDPLGGWHIRVTSSVEEVFTTTDAEGNYSVNLPFGDFLVEPIIPIADNPDLYWLSCPEEALVTFSAPFQTEVADFGMQAGPEACPYPYIDLSAPFLRRCFESTYTATYCNYGNAPINNAEATIILDPWLEYVNSSIPLSGQAGDSLFFELGDLNPGVCETFTVVVLVDCDSTVLGQIHCSEALLSPTENCEEPGTDWDGSQIEVSAVCEGDSVIFSLTNIGNSAMSQALNYFVVEDQIILMDGPFILEPGEIFSITVNPDGETVSLIADQSAGLPNFSYPSVTVDGCGGDPPVTIYWGPEYPENDDAPWYSIDCSVNIGSFDPNDKKAAPAGYGPEGRIEANVDLDYHIRFQNTGTDTAFTVVIRDTLDSHLDPATARVGTASHPFTWQLMDQGVLEFRFDNIMLPDSNVNEPASHGFVKFRIAQDPDLPIGTEITNRAGIYFDFNEPIITNSTLHTIGELIFITGLAEPAVRERPIQVFPNPASGPVTIDLDGYEARSGEIRLFSADGRLQDQRRFTESRFTWQLPSLPAGMYILQVWDQGAILAIQKILIQP